MSHTRKPDPITGVVKQPLIKILVGGGGFFAVFTFMAAFLPSYSSVFFSIALLISIIGIASILWINYMPNLWAKFFGYVSIASLCTIIAVRAFDFLLPKFSASIGILIIITVIFTQTLPMWNLPLTRLIRGELSYSPKTKAGKLLLRASLALIPIAGFIGAVIGLHSKGKSAILILILGSVCWLLAIILPFSTHQPISPWEYEKQKKVE